MKRKIYVAIAVLIVMVMLVPTLGTACKPKPAGEIVIGMLAELTGPIAPAGIPSMQGATVGFEQLPHEVAGRPIKFVVEDTASEPGPALDKARKLVEVDGASMIQGPLFGSCIAAVAPYLDKAKVPYMMLEAAPGSYNLDYNWIWQPLGTQHQLDYGFGRFAYNELGYKTVTIMAPEVADGPEFMRGFKDGFTESGGQVVQEQYYPPVVDDFTPYLLRLQKADALETFHPGTYVFGFYKAVAELGLNMPIIECPGEMPSPPIQQALGDATIGVVFQAGYHFTLDTPGNKEFVDAYQKRWGELPTHIAGDAYRNAQLMLEALNKTGGDTSPEALAKAFGDISMDTVQGHVSFTPERIGVCEYTVYKIAKVGGEKTYEVLAKYRVMSKKVGDKLVSVMAE